MDLGLKWEPFCSRTKGKICIAGAILSIISGAVLAAVLAPILISSSNTSKLSSMTVTAIYFNLTYIDTNGGTQSGRNLLETGYGTVNVSNIEQQVILANKMKINLYEKKF